MKIPNSSVMGRVRDFLLKTIHLCSYAEKKGTWAYLIYRQTQQNGTKPPAVFEYMEWNENLIYVKKVE